MGAGIEEDLGTLEDPARAEVLRVRESDDLVAKFPVNEIARGVAGYVSLLGVIGLCAVFAEPVIEAFPMRDASSVGLNVLAAVVEPAITGRDGVRRRRRGNGGYESD